MYKKLFLILIIYLFEIADVIAETSVTTKKLPFKPDTTDIGGQIQKITFVFLLVVLIAYLLIYLIKKYYSKNILAKSSEGDLIKIIDRRYLARNLTIILIQINNTKYSLAQTQNELILLEKVTTQAHEQTQSIDPNKSTVS